MTALMARLGSKTIDRSADCIDLAMLPSAVGGYRRKRDSVNQ